MLMGEGFMGAVHPPFTIFLISDFVLQGVCQVREKSGNSLYPLKSQEKVREFSEKSGKSQGILVKSRNLFLITAN